MQTLANDYKRVKRRNEIQGNPDKSVEEELGYTAEQMKVGSPLYNTLANFYVTRREIGDTDALKYLHKKGSTALEYPSEYSSSIKLTIGDGNSRIVRDRRPVSSPHGSFGIGPENTTFRHIILKGMINNTAEIKSIQEEILKACETKGIDPETFCFDKYVLEKA